MNGGPLSIDWLKASLDATPPIVHAAIEAYDLGQSAGQVVSEVLWGDTNPSGSCLSHFFLRTMSVGVFPDLNLLVE